MPTPQATLLYRLQAIDSTLAKQRARIKAIDDTLGQNTEIQKARAELSQAEDRLSQLQTRTRALELENKSLTEKRNDAEKTLYGGHVTNPKELADLQHEVEALDRQRSKLEDDIVAVLMETEQAEEKSRLARETLEKLEARFAQSQAGLISEKNQLKVEQETYIRKRKEAAAGIDPTALARYEDLRPKKRGLAVSQFREGSCSVCGVEQTVVIGQQVRAGDKLVLCASCGRILAFP